MQLAWHTRLVTTAEPDDESATLPPNDTIPGELAIVERSKSDPLDASSESLGASPRLVDPGQSPEDLAITADQNRHVRALLARLPDRQRSIVELRLAGLSGAEIGRSLGMSESAVKSAQFRAYAILRELFRDHDLAPEHLEPPR